MITFLDEWSFGSAGSTMKESQPRAKASQRSASSAGGMRDLPAVRWRSLRGARWKSFFLPHAFFRRQEGLVGLRPQRREAGSSAVSQRQDGLQSRRRAKAGGLQSRRGWAQGSLGHGHLHRDGQQPPPPTRPAARRAAAHSSGGAAAPQPRQGPQEVAGLVVPAPANLIAED